MLDTLISRAAVAAGCYVCYIAVTLIYRFFFHPLRHIPGPKFAKATYLYEYYYDLYLWGQYTFKLQELHKEYGPIIRINPDEIHINDPDYIDEVYNMGRVHKTPRLAEVFGPHPAIISTQPHELHRLRRRAINPFFSKKAVAELIPAIQGPIDILCKRLEDASETGETLNMKYMYAAVTMDIIRDYCFARPPENVFKPDFGRKAFDDVDGFIEASILNVHIPWFMRISLALPNSVNKILAPAMADIFEFRSELSTQVEAIRNGENRSYEKVGHRTVFHELLESKLPPEELERDRLRDEAFGLVTAGSDTTAMVLRGTSYHISVNPSIRQRLYDELKAAIPDPSKPPPPQELEQLPYLSAVVLEGLRVCEPVSHRSNREFPDKALNYKGYIIPPGTGVGMTSYHTHHNEEIFPDSYAFKPERWLEGGKQLERYLVPFNRGTRACLGLNLARTELFMILAAVFRQFDFDVSRVSRERDIDVTRDFILGGQAKDTPGILVKVKKC
ncbi:benzoate 4-monooxygenase cytochrome P450, putative [Paecilomyces variotii No. 5]|uniref:Benzoate 4-monooxygenase cytochrome P450, putative n=1 Tax=Byssochlamys spectabilis (strain No. 5 / NBRC 109023) TaxID=1356009 RepID=V5FI06_BYSSN|nr:benzoate 4-monooxygenase cytochrome P450, putative [Paecilomyces variotii No. 5]